jgi:formamidopyrimidine-DNA glycosylase
MPELPEVEVLARHLAPRLKDKVILDVEIRRARVLRPTPPKQLRKTLRGASFAGLTRRGKYLVFTLRAAGGRKMLDLLGHLGMTGRMYLQPSAAPLPKHAALVLRLGQESFIFEDSRYFGRLTLDASVISALGPEPLGDGFTSDYLANALKRSAQAVKVKLLDQSIVAGVGNIYASEALFRAGIPPRLASRWLRRRQVEQLWRSVREVLARAIRLGSTLGLDWAGAGNNDGIFYYGRDASGQEFSEERLQVYDRAGKPCYRCQAPIKRIVQGGRSTFYCPHCQRNGDAKTSVDGSGVDL